ncbi:MAG TPA: hypothetical protein VF278_03425 [Pirellulales bacterium]
MPHGSAEGQSPKQWLLGKTQALLGISRLRAQLTQEHGESLAAQGDARQLQAAANETLARLALKLDTCAAAVEQWKAGNEAAEAAPSPPSPADLERLRAIEGQGLFIFGCARSGTTILMDSLNRSPEVFLLAEPDISFHEHETDFVTYHNAKHVGYANRRMKGNYLPPPILPENGPLDALLRLARDYRHVGEKTAIGPGDYPADWQQMYLDFHAKYFLRGRHIFILRRPVESIWSMTKLFPTWPLARLFRAWLQTTSLVLEAYHLFPHSRVVFFEDLADVMIHRLGQWLETSIPTVPGTFGDNYVRSAVLGNDVPAPLRPFGGLCRAMTGLYRDLRESFSHEEYVYRGSASEWAYFDARWREVAAMLSRLAAGEGEEERQLAA